MFSVSCYLLSFEIFISDATSQAFLLVAIFLFELDEGLAVACILHFQSALLPHSYDVVVLGAEGFEEIEGSVAIFLFPTMSAVGEENGDDGVDNQ